jgi:hypothetical protein
VFSRCNPLCLDSCLLADRQAERLFALARGVLVLLGIKAWGSMEDAPIEKTYGVGASRF